MLKIHTLGTGSTGNCYIIQYNQTECFILETGISSKVVLNFLKTHSLIPKFILVSHEHGDHVGNAGSLSKQLAIKVLLHKNIKEIIHKISLFNVLPLKQDTIYTINDICKIKTFLLSHDVPNLGFQIEFLKTRESIFFATDLGTTNNLPLTFVSSIDNTPLMFDVIMFECNYGDNTLFNNIVDESSKIKNQRVKSDKGHLSNDDCFNYLRKLKMYDANVLLIHASLDNLNVATDYSIFNSLPTKSWAPISKQKTFILDKK